MKKFPHADFDTSYAICEICDDGYSVVPVDYSFYSNGTIFSINGGYCAECKHDTHNEFFEDCLSCEFVPG